MKWHRISASILHSFYHLTHSVETWVDLFWFSIIDVVVFGFISQYLSRGVDSGTFLIAGIILWEVVRVVQYTVTASMLWEIWSKSFSSMFISPITMWEFLLGQIISSLIKSLMVMTIVASIAYFLFNFSIFTLALSLPLSLLSLFVFAVATAIFILALLLRFGTNIQSLAWGLIFLFQPISAIFYPLSVLPPAVQVISLASPITYIMESTRSQLSTGTIIWHYLFTSLLVSLIYLILCVVFMNSMLAWSKKTGAFARMGN